MFNKNKALVALDAVTAFLSEINRGDSAYKCGDAIDIILRQCEHFYNEITQYPASIIDANPEKIFWEPLENMLGSCLEYLKK